MRKLFAFLFAALLLFGFSIPLSAQGKTWYYSDDLSIAVPVTDDTAILSRNMSADDPFLTKMGQSRETILASYKQNNVYLELWKTDFSSVISFNMTASSFNDMNNFKEADWGNFIDSTVDEFSDADISDIVIFPSPYRTYAQFTVYAYDGERNIYIYYYVTIYQGKKIAIQLFALSGEPSEDQTNAFSSFVEDVYYGTEEEIFGGSVKYTGSAPNASLIYTDIPVNTSFIVPANWSPEPVTGTDPFVTAVFVLNTDNDMAIVYGGEDQWAKKFKSLGGGISPADINNHYFTESQIEGMFDFPTSISVKYIDDVKYFQFTTKSGNQTSTSMIMYHNAVFYWFEFYGDETNPYYDDFISLLKSVKYPSVGSPVSSASTPAASAAVSAGSSASASVASSISKSVPASTASSAASAVSESSSSAGTPVAAENNCSSFSDNIQLYIALAAVLFALPMLVYRYAVRRRSVEPKPALLLILIYGMVSLGLLVAATVIWAGSWIVAGALLLWHIASYFMLTCGKRSEHKQLSAVMPEPVNNGELNPDELTQVKTPEPEGQDDKQALYCGMCGFKLQTGSKFCPKCGEKSETPEK